jgi:predicted RNA binding protein YcfA (HicA-like mRNA interferase family)
MPVTYDQFRQVLRKLGYELVRSRKHETWRLKLPDGTERTIRVSHQHGRDIPPPIFAEMLRQAGMTRDEFERWRRDP